METELSREQEALREEINKEFDDENEDLVQEWGVDSDKYKKKRERFFQKELQKKLELRALQQENQDLRQKVERFSQALESAKERIRKLMFDSVTGLRKREGLYITLERDITELVDGKFSNIEELETDELIELLNPESVKEVPLTVMMSDVSYLSLANEGGHEAGDSLLEAIGTIARDKMGSPTPEAYQEEESYEVDCQRHGGDEMTAIMRLDINEAGKQARSFELAVNNESVPALEEYGFKPNIDTGVAHISEALEAYQEFIKIKKEAGEEMPKGDRIRNLLNIWVAIADRRSAVSKGVTRLSELKRERVENRTNYDIIISFLRKGAFNTTDEELDSLIEREKNGEDWDTISGEHIKKIATRPLTKEKETEKRRRQIIIDIADRDLENN